VAAFADSPRDCLRLIKVRPICPANRESNDLDHPNGTTRHLPFDVAGVHPRRLLWSTPSALLISAYERLIGDRGRKSKPEPPFTGNGACDADGYRSAAGSRQRHGYSQRHFPVSCSAELGAPFSFLARHHIRGADERPQCLQDAGPAISRRAQFIRRKPRTCSRAPAKSRTGIIRVSA